MKRNEDNNFKIFFFFESFNRVIRIFIFLFGSLSKQE